MDGEDWSPSWSALNFLSRFKSVDFKSEIKYNSDLDVFKLICCQYVKNITNLIVDVINEIYVKTFCTDFDSNELLTEFQKEILSSETHHDVYLALDYFRSQICIDISRSEHSIAEILDSDVNNLIGDFFDKYVNFKVDDESFGN